MKLRAPDFRDKGEKLEELILFIASRSEDDERFGSIKLNKLLFYADFLAYLRLGDSITGQRYQRLPRGPAPRAVVPVMKVMEATKSLAIKNREYFGRIQKVPVALRPANLKCFSSEEIAIVTEVMDALRKKNAKGISTLSHQFDGWKLAKDGEDIPYEVALVQFKKPRKKDVKKATDMGETLIALRRECGHSDAD